jgi:AhpD family alkylhydroperoxidase
MLTVRQTRVSTDPMARIAPLHPDQFAPELRAVVGDDGLAHPELLGSLRVWARRPELAAAILSFRSAIAAASLLPPRLVELVRLRVAFHNQCRSCMAIRYTDAIDAGLTEDLVCSLERPYEAPGLTDAERVAIRFGELMATNHLAIDDQLWEQLGEHFDDGEIVELALHVALFVGVGRLGAVLHMVEELPTAFQDAEIGAGAVAPWGNDAVVVR